MIKRRINLNNNLKKIIAISMCSIVALSVVGCSISKKSEISVKKEDVIDVRNAKIIGQQQALLLFTSKNKDGSVKSIELSLKKPEVKKDDKNNDNKNTEDKDKKDNNESTSSTEKERFVYRMDVVTKKGNNFIVDLNAKDGAVLKNENKGILPKNLQKDYITFVPVLDLDKACDYAERASKEHYDQIIAYKLYAKGDLNIYEFTLADDYPDSDKTEKVLINAFTGKTLTKEDITKAEESKSNTQTPATSTNQTTKTEAVTAPAE